jgi:hypothetical protein
MITFTSFPLSKDSFNYGSAKFVDEDAMDVDFDDDEEDFDSGSKLTCPGEPITSSQAFMRCVLFLASSPHFLLVARESWTYILHTNIGGTVHI